MTFRIVYRQEVARITQAVIIDNRVSLGLANENGNGIQAYVDNEIAGMGDDPPFYIIEASNGSLCGYFTLTISGDDATVNKKNFRVQYYPYHTTFDTMISAFIVSKKWETDVLV